MDNCILPLILMLHCFKECPEEAPSPFTFGSISKIWRQRQLMETLAAVKSGVSPETSMGDLELSVPAKQK